MHEYQTKKKKSTCKKNPTSFYCYNFVCLFSLCKWFQLPDAAASGGGADGSGAGFTFHVGERAPAALVGVDGVANGARRGGGSGSIGVVIVIVVVVVESLFLLTLLDAVGVHLEFKANVGGEIQQVTHNLLNLAATTGRRGGGARPDAKDILVAANTHDETNNLVAVKARAAGKVATNKVKQQQLPVQPRLVPRVHSGGGSSSSSFVVAAAGIDALGLKGPLEPEHPLATIEVYGILPHGLDATPKHLKFTCKRETINALQVAVHKPELLDGGKGADLLGGKKIVGHFDSGPAVHEPHRVIVVQWCLGWHRRVQVVRRVQVGLHHEAARGGIKLWWWGRRGQGVMAAMTVVVVAAVVIVAVVVVVMVMVVVAIVAMVVTVVVVMASLFGSREFSAGRGKER